MSTPQSPETVEVEFISPRHLAGGGDPAWITVPLHRACGWSHGHDPLMPRVILSSPDQKALLRLEPNPEGQWWTLRHAPAPDHPAWYASFGARTPVEIIAAFTDALTAPAVTATASADPYEPLHQADWSPARGADGLVSPDGTAYVQRLGVEEPGPWFVTATLGQDRPVWQARFAERTPPHLIAAFTAALVDPSPVPRADSPRMLATRNPNLITRTHQEVPAAQVVSALEKRVEALTRHRIGPPPTPSALRPPPPRNGRSR
ncbi:DUF317 domain-containing protein [Streptomyces sp. NPDC018352]|uniref:DUF317 domain-containing protein n=1 Tax=Streptomyces sp. NPDC018352 TaxID=3157194 RepID=UPI0033E3276A